MTDASLASGQEAVPSASRGTTSEAGAEDAIGRAIRAFQGGDDPDAAFRVLYETYFPALQRFFARKGLKPEDGLDLTQETFLRVYRALDGYEHRERFAPWLYRVATTTFLKSRRRAATAKRSAIEVSRDAMEHPDPSLAIDERQLEDMLDTERRRALRRAIRRLPEQQRDCLTLRLHQQLSYREIAVIKKLAVETVKAHLFRARKQLRETLAEHPLQELDAIDEPGDAP
ncbi:MAG: RNA polymerase sigma factor [Acidobacteriota bacterium]|nr:RNA polymerase sigma factor [Acidobacteriota bacterium]